MFCIVWILFLNKSLSTDFTSEVAEICVKSDEEIFIGDEPLGLLTANISGCASKLKIQFSFIRQIFELIGLASICPTNQREVIDSFTQNAEKLECFMKSELDNIKQFKLKVDDAKREGYHSEGAYNSYLNEIELFKATFEEFKEYKESKFNDIKAIETTLALIKSDE